MNISILKLTILLFELDNESLFLSATNIIDDHPLPDAAQDDPARGEDGLREQLQGELCHQTLWRYKLSKDEFPVDLLKVEHAIGNGGRDVLNNLLSWHLASDATA